MEGLSFERDGATRYHAVLTGGQVDEINGKLAGDLGAAPGRRLDGPTLRALPVDSLAGIATSLIGAPAFAVRAVLFDKTPETNWIVAWHQDRTIPVCERVETPGFGPWSIKAGQQHVAPPIEVLEGMATLRLHLDDCDEDNAPLRIALGSHKLGLAPAGEAAARAAALPQIVCQAAAGDVWAYSTPILHMSERTRSERRRRVLQVDFAARDLPGGLEWLF